MNCNLFRPIRRFQVSRFKTIRKGRYFNSPTDHKWVVVGIFSASDRYEAMEKAKAAIGDPKAIVRVDSMLRSNP